VDLFIIRHGKAEEYSPKLKSDSKRKLTEEGKKELELISKGLKNLNIKIDCIISSPLNRAMETSEILSQYLIVKEKKITLWDELKPESNVLDTHEKISTFSPDSKILLVGHEPHLTNLISSIISPRGNVSINLKKGGFVAIRITNSKSKIEGSLRSVLTPKQLKLCK
jgi:phosphohistidine phosphatase